MNWKISVDRYIASRLVKRFALGFIETEIDVFRLPIVGIDSVYLIEKTLFISILILVG